MLLVFFFFFFFFTHSEVIILTKILVSEVSLLDICLVISYFIFAVNFGSLDFNMTVRSDEAVGSRIHGIYIDGGEGGYQGGLTLSPVTQYFHLDDRKL